MRKYHILFLSFLAVILASCSSVKYASDSNAEFDDIYYVSSDSDPTEVTLEDDYAGYHSEKNAPQNAPQEDYWEEDTRGYSDPGTGNTYNYNNYSNTPWGMSPNPYYGWGNYPGFTFSVGYNNFYHRWRPYCGVSYGFSAYPFAGSYYFGSSPYYSPWYYNSYYDPFYNPIGYCYNPWIYNPYWSGYAYGYGGYNYGYGYGSDVVFTGNGAYYGQHSGFNTGSLVNSTYTQGAIYNEAGKVVATVKPIDPSQPAIERPISALNAERPINGSTLQDRPQMNGERPSNPAIRPVSPESRPSTGVTRPANPERPSSPTPSTRPSQPNRPSGGGTRPSSPSNNTPARPSKNRGGGQFIGAMMEIGASVASSVRETNSTPPRTSWSNQSNSNPSRNNSSSSSSRPSTSQKSSSSSSRSTPSRSRSSNSASKSISRSNPRK